MMSSGTVSVKLNNIVTEPTNYMKLSKKITHQRRQFSKLKPI
jgi:hypothetical protein